MQNYEPFLNTVYCSTKTTLFCKVTNLRLIYKGPSFLPVVKYLVEVKNFNFDEFTWVQRTCQWPLIFLRRNNNKILLPFKIYFSNNPFSNV